MAPTINHTQTRIAHPAKKTQYLTFTPPTHQHHSNFPTNNGGSITNDCAQAIENTVSLSNMVLLRPESPNTKPPNVISHPWLLHIKFISLFTDPEKYREKYREVNKKKVDS